MKDDFTNLQQHYPDHLVGMRSELEAIKSRLRQQLQAEVAEDKAKLAEQWAKLAALQERAGLAVTGSLQGAKDGLRTRMDAVQMPPQLAGVKAELEKALGNLHLPPAAVAQLDAVKLKMSDMVKTLAEEKAELAGQLERLKETQAGAKAAAAAAAVGGAGAAAVGAAKAFFAGGSTVAAEGQEGIVASARRALAPLAKATHVVWLPRPST